MDSLLLREAKTRLQEFERGLLVTAPFKGLTKEEIGDIGTLTLGLIGRLQELIKLYEDALDPKKEKEEEEKRQKVSSILVFRPVKEEDFKLVQFNKETGWAVYQCVKCSKEFTVPSDMKFEDRAAEHCCAVSYAVTVQNALKEQEQLTKKHFMEAYGIHSLAFKQEFNQSPSLRQLYEEGEQCAIYGCDGRLVYQRSKECHCHISPPCAACVNALLVCNECEEVYESV